MLQDRYEAGDNLFEVIFEIDRKLQHAQQSLVPISNLQESLKFLDSVMVALEDRQTESSDSIFMKLIDCFCRCNNNAKREHISTFLKECKFIPFLNAPQSEVLKRLKLLWDNSIQQDYETCRQILMLLQSTIRLFFSNKIFYALLYEALDADISGPMGHFTYQQEAVKLSQLAKQSCLAYIYELEQTKNQDGLEQFLTVYKFADSIINRP